jgi:hypothetical protein
VCLPIVGMTLEPLEYSVFEKDWAHPFALRTGKIARLREFYDTATIADVFRGDRTRPHHTSDVESRKT